MSYVIEIPGFEMPHSKHEQHLCFLQNVGYVGKSLKSTRGWSGVRNSFARTAGE